MTRPESASAPDILAAGDPDAVLALWNDALGVTLRSAELEGLVTALYTVGGPVRIDALFEAYETARRQAPLSDSVPAGTRLSGGHQGLRYQPDVVALSAALETLADLGVVDLGSDEEAGVLTVVLSRLGTWGVHARLRARGWQLPVVGAARPGPRGRCCWPRWPTMTRRKARPRSRPGWLTAGLQRPRPS